MDTYTDLYERSQKLFEDAKAIIGNPDASAEDQAKVKPMLEDAKKLRADAAQVKQIEEALEDGAQILRRVPEQKAAPKPPQRPKEFKSMGEFWMSVYNAYDVRQKGNIDQRLKRWYEPEDQPLPAHKDAETGWEEKATMVENIGARGGFLVPVEQQEQLYGVDPMRTPIRSRSTIIPMRRRQINIPVLDQTGTTAGQPHWFGGMLATWTEEAASKTQSDPTFRQVKLVAHKLICYTRASDELLDDSAVSLDAFLRGPMGFGGAIDWYSEYAFLQGTGAGQPLGVINAGATISVTATASPPAPGSLYTDLVNMLESFLPGANGVWMVNQRHMSDLLTMNGPAGNASYLWGSAADGAPGTLLGYPVIFTEKLPGPGTSGSIVLADWRYYLIGDRQAVTIDSSNHELFQYDQTSWRAVARLDGQPWLSAPLTLSDGTAQVSPFVILGAKST